MWFYLKKQLIFPLYLMGVTVSACVCVFLLCGGAGVCLSDGGFSSTVTWDLSQRIISCKCEPKSVFLK